MDSVAAIIVPVAVAVIMSGSTLAATLQSNKLTQYRIDQMTVQIKELGAKVDEKVKERDKKQDALQKEVGSLEKHYAVLETSVKAIADKLSKLNGGAKG